MFSLVRQSSIFCKILQQSVKSVNQPNLFRRTKTYKAALLNKFNKPLTIENVNDVDEIRDGMVRIGVYYCSLNATDVKLFTGFNAENLELPAIPGYEFSGEIIDCKKNNKQNFKIGDRVVALKGNLNCGGGLAGQAIVNEMDCWFCNNVSLRDSAILPFGHGTAMLAFTKYCEIDENDTIIVTAGAGGLGLAAIEVAASIFKAKVIAICDTESSSNLIRDEGAFKAICVKEGLPKIHKFLEKSLNGKKAKIGLDAVGDGLLHLLDEFVDPIKGTLISVDPFYDKKILSSQKLDYKKTTKSKKKTDDDNNDDEKKTSKRPSLETRVKHVNLYKYRETDVDFYRQIISDTLVLCEEELISAYVSGVFQLEEIDKAIEFIRNKKCTGKVLIEIREEAKKKKAAALLKDKQKEDEKEKEKVKEENLVKEKEKEKEEHLVKEKESKKEKKND